MTDRPVDAEEALRMGLVARVVDEAILDAEAESLACRLANGPTTALGRTKKLLSQSDRSLRDQLNAEAASIALCADGPEGRAGVRAFVERGVPVFRPDARAGVPR